MDSRYYGTPWENKAVALAEFKESSHYRMMLEEEGRTEEKITPRAYR